MSRLSIVLPLALVITLPGCGGGDAVESASAETSGTDSTSGETGETGDPGETGETTSSDEAAGPRCE